MSVRLFSPLIGRSAGVFKADAVSAGVQQGEVASFCSDLVCSDSSIISGHFDCKIRVWDSRFLFLIFIFPISHFQHGRRSESFKPIIVIKCYRFLWKNIMSHDVILTLFIRFMQLFEFNRELEGDEDETNGARETAILIVSISFC